MTPSQLLNDAFGRIHDDGLAVVDSLNVDQLASRPGPQANSIGWLVWHLARVQDDHIADVGEMEQVWTAQDFVSRFDLPFPPSEIGFGHSTDQVAAVRVDADLLAAYLSAVHAQTTAYVDGLEDSDLDRVVDTRWDPPVTLGARLVSVLNDDTKHLGQAEYIRGLLEA
jgi:uncharacterized damage-inducible protein DinB